MTEQLQLHSFFKQNIFSNIFVKRKVPLTESCERLKNFEASYQGWFKLRFHQSRLNMSHTKAPDRSFPKARHRGFQHRCEFRTVRLGQKLSVFHPWGNWQAAECASQTLRNAIDTTRLPKQNENPAKRSRSDLSSSNGTKANLTNPNLASTIRMSTNHFTIMIIQDNYLTTIIVQWKSGI